MKALLLDDNLMSATRVEAQLKAAGYAPTTRARLPQEGEFDLVLINLGSRRLGGVELIAPAKAQFPEAKVWGFCGHLETEIRQAAREAGIDRLLTNDNAMSDLAEKLPR